MDYEILIRRRGENIYAAFCPQLDLVITGTAHAEVEEKMRKLIEQYKAEHTSKESAQKQNGAHDNDTSRT